MKHHPEPLPAHPTPHSDKSIGRWIERLADANKATFKLMIFHIADIAKEVGFLQALSDLTRIPLGHIAKLHNEFKPDFWKTPKECPIRDCPYTAKVMRFLFDHLAFIHDLGVIWHECSQPKCEL
ncbi:MAG: hypothetical protein ACTSQI_20075 [Candidatus Helarchaeota archaeon]